MTPHFSLIVSTLGRTTQMERLLTSLAAQDFKSFEVIVVDQNDDTRLAPIVAAYRDAMPIVHTRSGRGVSHGRNVGLAVARGALVAFPDDDCWYPAGLMSRIEAYFTTNDDIDLVSGRTVDASLAESLGVYLTQSQRIDRRNIWRIGNSNTIFVRRREGLHFNESLGVGSKTKFQSGEETDFLLRLLDAGARLEYDPSLLVHHDQIDLRGDQEGVRRARAYAPGQGRVLRLHQYGFEQALWFALRPAARACIATLRGDRALARYKLAWAHGIVSGYLSAMPQPPPTVADLPPKTAKASADI